MKPIGTTMNSRARSTSQGDRLAGLLLCVLFAATELLEALRQPRSRSPEERPA